MSSTSSKETSPGTRALQFTHGLVSALLILTGMGFFAFGIYHLTHENIVTDDFDYPQSNTMDRLAVDFGTSSIIIAAYFVVMGIIGFVALVKKLIGKVFRLVFFVALVVSLASLCFTVAVTTRLVIGRKPDSKLQTFIQTGFENTVASSKPERICTLEREKKCRGYLDHDCENCALGNEVACDFGIPKLRCAKCNNAAANPAVGCSDEIFKAAKKYYLLLLVASCVLIAVIVFDMVVVCCL
jgi:Tetraspanin family